VKNKPNFQANRAIRTKNLQVEQCNLEQYIDPSTVEFHWRTACVEFPWCCSPVVAWPVTPPSNFCCAVAVIFYPQFFDAVTEKIGLQVFECCFISSFTINR